MDALFDVTPDWSGPVSVREAAVSGREWTITYHYTGSAPGASVYYGVYCPDLVATVAIGTGANRHSMGKAFGLSAWKGDLEITRVVCHPDAPKNTASQGIAAVLKYVHRQKTVDWVFSYADTGQGHHGGIYQALNATYVGLSQPFSYGYYLDGERVHQRTISATFGTVKWPDAADLAKSRGQVLERVAGVDKPKHTYILPCSTPAVNRAIRRALEPHTLPYPKRDVNA